MEKFWLILTLIPVSVLTVNSAYCQHLNSKITDKFLHLNRPTPMYLIHLSGPTWNKGTEIKSNMNPSYCGYQFTLAVLKNLPTCKYYIYDSHLPSCDDFDIVIYMYRTT